MWFLIVTSHVKRLQLQAEGAIQALNCSGMILGTLPVRHDPLTPIHLCSLPEIQMHVYLLTLVAL